jgi:hypothetical protein
MIPGKWEVFFDKLPEGIAISSGKNLWYSMKIRFTS